MKVGGLLFLISSLLVGIVVVRAFAVHNGDSRVSGPINTYTFWRSVSPDRQPHVYCASYNNSTKQSNIVPINRYINDTFQISCGKFLIVHVSEDMSYGVGIAFP